MQKKIILVVACLAVSVFFHTGFCQTSSNFRLKRWHLSGTFGGLSSGTYSLNHVSLGDLVFGECRCSSYILNGSLYFTRVSDNSLKLFEFSLQQNFPNPFNPITTLEYRLPGSTNVQIHIYNSRGQIVQTLDQGFQQPGNYSVTWDARSLPSGIYFYQIHTDEFSDVKKMALIR